MVKSLPTLLAQHCHFCLRFTNRRGSSREHFCDVAPDVNIPTVTFSFAVWLCCGIGNSCFSLDRPLQWTPWCRMLLEVLFHIIQNDKLKVAGIGIQRKCDICQMSLVVISCLQPKSILVLVVVCGHHGDKTLLRHIPTRIRSV